MWVVIAVGNNWYCFAFPIFHQSVELLRWHLVVASLKPVWYHDCLAVLMPASNRTSRVVMFPQSGIALWTFTQVLLAVRIRSVLELHHLPPLIWHFSVVESTALSLRRFWSRSYNTLLPFYPIYFTIAFDLKFGNLTLKAREKSSY